MRPRIACFTAAALLAAVILLAAVFAVVQN